jgi:hypothetical protein
LLLRWELKQARQLRDERQSLQSELEALRRETRGAVELGVRAGRRLRKAEQQMQQLQDRLGFIELRNEGRAYDQAINLARRGADATKLVSDFGMSQGEADLVSLLHGRRRAS